MAGDTEDLVLSISADVRQMQRALTRITGDTAKTTAAIAKHFDSLGDVGGRAFDKVAANSNKAAASVQAGAAKINGAIKASSVQTGNLAAQLNDIGVQLAGGQSPFLIALQQGSQITQVLGGSGARGAVSALAGAFASLVNPVSLATIGIISLGGAAVQYFASMLSDGEKSAETLKQEADLIRQVAKEWGDAVPAIKAYAAERERIASERQLIEARDITAAEQYDNARQAVSELGVDVADLVSKLQMLGVAPEIIVRIQQSFSELQGKVRDNTATAEDAQRVQAALAAVLAQQGIPAAEGLAKTFEALAGAIAKASAAAASFKEPVLTKDGFLLGPAGPDGNPLRSELSQLGTVSPIFSGGGGFLDANGLQSQRANATKSQTQIAAEAAARSRSKAASEAEREAKAVADLIEQLEFEQSLIGMTNLEREQATALRRAGSAATADQQEKIKGLIAATVTEREAIKAQEEAYKSLQQIGTQAINSLATALSDGKLEAQELLSILMQVVQQFLNMPGGFASIGRLFGFGGGTTSFASEILSGARVGLFHSGGVVGAHTQSRMVHPGIFANAPRMHSGGIAGSLRSGEVPAILQRGEVVLPRGASLRGGQRPLQVTVNEAPGQKAETRLSNDGNQLEITMRALARDEQRKSLPKSLSSGFGITPKVTRRF